MINDCKIHGMHMNNSHNVRVYCRNQGYWVVQEPEDGAGKVNEDQVRVGPQNIVCPGELAMEQFRLPEGAHSPPDLLTGYRGRCIFLLNTYMLCIGYC